MIRSEFAMNLQRLEYESWRISELTEYKCSLLLWEPLTSVTSEFILMAIMCWHVQKNVARSVTDARDNSSAVAGERRKNYEWQDAKRLVDPAVA
jgi:hypothetical protein